MTQMRQPEKKCGGQYGDKRQISPEFQAEGHDGFIPLPAGADCVDRGQCRRAGAGREVVDIDLGHAAHGFQRETPARDGGPVDDVANRFAVLPRPEDQGLVGDHPAHAGVMDASH